MSKNTCPICGDSLDDFVAELLDNGSPAHPECVERETQRSETKENEENKNG